ncbi:peptide transporter family 1 isoform X2 [Pseudomyrmex gracilis]|uniref:peptide transporter family 1 isoform X2 n=1 Tax=Pseudomyrmex gracilis TaxID=219809 RepID=UPI00099567AB|nr:peptide transporter family 1 isoform X2 [Pseudomyrmex gracilis]
MDAQVKQKLKYPKSVFFIVSNEFCERFSFYGMRTVLSLYLTTMLNYNEDTATMIYHIFTCFVYFFPLFGAILSDSWLGKFNTIFYVSIIYAIGQLILATSAIPVTGLGLLDARALSLFGLFLIALGTGGIKPCVSAFGGDQFVLPQQERYLTMFFSVFYFSINTGSLISTLLTPTLRELECWNDKCFSLAFLVPAVLMIVSIVVFAMGKRLYKIVKPKGNLIVTVSQCIGHAIYNKVKNKTKRDHWLDHADDVYERTLIDDIKASLRVLKMFIPLPIFWALYDQQGSQWTFQATRMDGQIGNWVLLPDQMQAVNPLLIMIFIPLFETCIYPMFAKIHLINTPLRKLVVGGFLASVAFIAAGLVELKLETTYPILPSEGLAQIRIFNTMNCTVHLKLDMPDKTKTATINGLKMYEMLYVKANETGVTLPYTADFIDCNLAGYTSLRDNVKGNITGKEADATSWIITPIGLDDNNKYIDKVDKPANGNPMVRGVIYLTEEHSNATLTFKYNNEVTTSIPMTKLKSSLVELDKPGEYDIYLDKTLLKKAETFKLGGVYTVLGSLVKLRDNDVLAAKIITVTKPNEVHIAYLLPQYIIITMAEVMFSITGLEFAFTQAPKSMKSLLQAGWLLSNAFGNLIVVIIKGSHPFQRQMYEIFLYAGLMAVVMAIFTVMSIFYKYVDIPDEEEDGTTYGAIPLDEKKGNDNPAYKEDEK